MAIGRRGRHADYFTCRGLAGNADHLWQGRSSEESIIVILCAGAIYNPLGFLVKAINPQAGQSDALLGRILVCTGFLPATIGFGYAMWAVIDTLI